MSGIYFEKYMKYKVKYNQLKKQLGGNIAMNNNLYASFTSELEKKNILPAFNDLYNYIIGTQLANDKGNTELSLFKTLDSSFLKRAFATVIKKRCDMDVKRTSKTDPVMQDLWEIINDEWIRQNTNKSCNKDGPLPNCLPLKYAGANLTYLKDGKYLGNPDLEVLNKIKAFITLYQKK